MMADFVQNRNDVAARGGPLREEEELLFQAQLWAFLRTLAARYTSGESSSLPIETVQRLLDSLSFTLRLNLRENTPELRAMIHADWSAAWRDGLKEIQKKVAFAKELWQMVCASLPKVENLSLTQTLQSIGAFWELYDPRYFAHEIPCDIDYQLALPVPDGFWGVDYITEYLRRLFLENGFLGHFDRGSMQALLKNYCPDPYGMLINLYEPAAVNTLGLMMAEENPCTLEMTSKGLARVYAKLANRRRREIEKELTAAAAKAGTFFQMDAPSQSYLNGIALSLYPRLKIALDYGTLDGIFLKFRTTADWLEGQYR